MTPGASGSDIKEKVLTLGLARALRDQLVREGGVRVALTRDDDRFLVLDERAEIARALGADLFLSIHADSAGEQLGISGASVYTLSARASSEAAARFAARENSADMVNGVRLRRPGRQRQRDPCRAFAATHAGAVRRIRLVDPS
jgi:N-acetylmuramoyl-L-alanine amidase